MKAVSMGVVALAALALCAASVAAQEHREEAPAAAVADSAVRCAEAGWAELLAPCMDSRSAGILPWYY